MIIEEMYKALRNKRMKKNVNSVSSCRNDTLLQFKPVMTVIPQSGNRTSMLNFRKLKHTVNKVSSLRALRDFTLATVVIAGLTRNLRKLSCIPTGCKRDYTLLIFLSLNKR
jgi:hypothetical protein